MAISVKALHAVIKEPITPCGACRQVMVEYERNQQSDITVFLKGEVGEIYELKSIGDLVFGTRQTSGDANTTTSERLRIRSDGRS